MVKEDAHKAQASSKKGGKTKLFPMMLVACIAMPFMFPSILLILAALAPTYVAFATDKDSEKSGGISVCVMNLAGTMPFLLDLWIKGQTLNNALRFLGDSNFWFVVLGAAAVGQLIAYAVPQAMVTLSVTHSEVRMKALKKNLELLKESWGADVASPDGGKRNIGN